MNLYYIGGSPCSGKSTIAEITAKKYGLFYFKVDNFLEKYIKLGAEEEYSICTKQLQMSTEQIWMREAKVQCDEEIQFYHEIFEFIQEDIRLISDDRNIITEGAAFLPELMKECNIVNSRYVCITPTKEFQIEHFKKREWISYILDECSDKEQSFVNWMDRDALFAEKVRTQCINAGYKGIITDGRMGIEDVVEIVCRQFELEK